MMSNYNFSEVASVDRDKKCIGIRGGYSGISPTWEEYKNSMPEDIAPIMESFLQFIKGTEYYGEGAMTINNLKEDGLEWEFDDSQGLSWEISFSFRGWGDFMAAAENICEEMGYTCFY